MNAVFSPDGKWLAFMGITNNAWNVFLWQVGSSSLPVNMTNSTGQTRNEDPKFSADGKSLFFKQSGDVMQATLSYTSTGPIFTSVVDITNTAPATENSMPFATPDGSAVYFATGTGAGMGLYKETIATHATVNPRRRRAKAKSRNRSIPETNVGAAKRAALARMARTRQPPSAYHRTLKRTSTPEHERHP